jgi:hypothetical protein
MKESAAPHVVVVMMSLALAIIAKVTTTTAKFHKVATVWAMSRRDSVLSNRFWFDCLFFLATAMTFFETPCSGLGQIRTHTTKFGAHVRGQIVIFVTKIVRLCLIHEPASTSFTKGNLGICSR